MILSSWLIAALPETSTGLKENIGPLTMSREFGLGLSIAAALLADSSLSFWRNSLILIERCWANRAFILTPALLTGVKSLWKVRQSQIKGLSMFVVYPAVGNVFRIRCCLFTVR